MKKKQAKKKHASVSSKSEIEKEQSQKLEVNMSPIASKSEAWVQTEIHQISRGNQIPVKDPNVPAQKVTQIYVPHSVRYHPSELMDVCYLKVDIERYNNNRKNK